MPWSHSKGLGLFSVLRSAGMGDLGDTGTCCDSFDSLK